MNRQENNRRQVAKTGCGLRCDLSRAWKDVCETLREVPEAIHELLTNSHELTYTSKKKSRITDDKFRENFKMIGCHTGRNFQVTVAGGSYQDGLSAIVQCHPPGMLLM